MIMKKLFAFILSLVALTTLSAQITHTAKGAVDQTANTILQEVADKWAKASFKFDVTVVNYDVNKKETFRQNANITYRTPCYIVKAGDIEIYCDGKSVYQVNMNAKEVVITPMSNSDDDLTNPASLLANYQNNYRAKYIREENGLAIIDLQPKNGHQYHKLRLFVDVKAKRLKKVEQHNYDSSRSEYGFSNYSMIKITPEAFKYTVPQDYETIDMR